MKTPRKDALKVEIHPDRSSMGEAEDPAAECRRYAGLPRRHPSASLYLDTDSASGVAP